MSIFFLLYFHFHVLPPLFISLLLSHLTDTLPTTPPSRSPYSFPLRAASPSNTTGSSNRLNTNDWIFCHGSRHIIQFKPFSTPLFTVSEIYTFTHNKLLPAIRRAPAYIEHLWKYDADGIYFYIYDSLPHANEVEEEDILTTAMLTDAALCLDFYGEEVPAGRGGRPEAQVPPTPFWVYDKEDRMLRRILAVGLLTKEV